MKRSYKACEPTEGATVAPNGPAMAALLGAGAGCAAMGVLYTLAIASPRIALLLSWYTPSGALSGMSSVAVILWLLVWALLHRRWSATNVAPMTALLASVLLAVGMLLTFPPIARLF